IIENGRIHISTRRSNDCMVVSITDNGVGIPNENLSKISDPFFTTKSPGEGTGLGLFVTYTIIEEHRGSVRVVSEPNFGTKFIITLPIYQNIADHG
ncbi:MAG: ATP-binding protein, partial [Bacteroidota bacterium]